MRQKIKIGTLTIEAGGPFFLIAGPCVIEDEDITLEIAGFLKETGEKLQIPIIFKASCDKANRTSLGSFRGPGMDRGLEILQKVKDTTGLPVLSDVHQTGDVEKAAEILDVIQVPAFLCLWRRKRKGHTPPYLRRHWPHWRQIAAQHDCNTVQPSLAREKTLIWPERGARGMGGELCGG